jgi:hypothetical protein
MARRKKKPYRPGKDPVPPHLLGEIEQLGIPNLQRQQHSDFEAEQLAAGATSSGVLRSRVKTLFMLPDQHQALIEQAVQNMRAKGDRDIKPEDIILQESSIDRNFNIRPGPYAATCWFLRVHAIVEGDGNPSITNYQGSPRGDPRDKLPFSEEEQFDRRKYSHIASRLPDAHLEFLSWISWCMFPEHFTKRGVPPSKVKFAGTMFDAEEAKYLRGAADGKFQGICENIEFWYGDYEIWQRRTALIHKDYEKFRKKSLTAPLST